MLLMKVDHQRKKTKSSMFGIGKQTQTQEYASASLGTMSNTSDIHFSMLCFTGLKHVLN